MQRLDRERHARAARVFEQLAQAVAHHFARAGEVARHDLAAAILRQAADDEHEALRAERQRLVDGAAVVVVRGAPAFAIGRRKHAAAAEPGDGQAGVANAPRRVVEARRRHLVAPRRDAADAVPRTSLR